jgi:hypothetical protein
VHEVPCLAYALQHRLLTQLPAGANQNSSQLSILYADSWRNCSKIQVLPSLLFHCLGELDVEDVVVLPPQQKYFLQSI